MGVARGLAGHDQEAALARSAHCLARNFMAERTSAATASAARPASADAAPAPSPRRERRNAWSSRVSGSPGATSSRLRSIAASPASTGPPCSQDRAQTRRVHVEQVAGLLEQVHREVRVALEEADPPQALLRDAAGGEVGDAAVRELEPRVRDVLVPREHRHAHGRDRDRRGAHHVQHGVEVVDHEVEHDVHVERARLEHRQPVGLDELGAAHVRPRREQRGVEALDLPHLEHDLRAPRRRDHGVGLLDRHRHRLLHQGVAARGRGPLGRRAVLHRGDRDRDGLAGREQGVRAREGGAAVPLRHLAGPRGILVVDAGQIGLRRARGRRARASPPTPRRPRRPCGPCARLIGSARAPRSRRSARGSSTSGTPGKRLAHPRHRPLHREPLAEEDAVGALERVAGLPAEAAPLEPDAVQPRQPRRRSARLDEGRDVLR